MAEKEKPIIKIFTREVSGCLECPARINLGKESTPYCISKSKVISPIDLYTIPKWCPLPSSFDAKTSSQTARKIINLIKNMDGSGEHLWDRGELYEICRKRIVNKIKSRYLKEVGK